MKRKKCTIEQVVTILFHIFRESNATDNVTTVAAAIVLSSQIITSNSRQNAANGTFSTNAELVFTTNPVS